MGEHSEQNRGRKGGKRNYFLHRLPIHHKGRNVLTTTLEKPFGNNNNNSIVFTWRSRDPQKHFYSTLRRRTVEDDILWHWLYLRTSNV